MASLFQIRRGQSLTGSLESGELYYDITSQSLALGSDSGINIQLAKIGQTNSGSFDISGDLFVSGNTRIVGNLTFGDSDAIDTVTVVASFSSSLIPQSNNNFDLGDSTTYWKTGYISSITGSLSGSVNGVDVTPFSASVSQSIGNLNNTVAVYDTRLDNLEQHSGSVNSFTASITSSYNSTSESLNIVSQSLVNVSSSYIATSQSLDIVSASLLTFSASQYNLDSSSFDSRIDLVEATASYLNTTFSSSVAGRLDSVELYTASVSTSVGLLQSTASYLNTTFSTSVDSRLDSIEFLNTTYATTGSNTFKDNQIISGNLDVTGTITAFEIHTIIQSSSVIFTSGSNQIGDNQNDVLTITGSLNQTGSTSFSELTGSLANYSQSVDSRLNINVTNITEASASAWGAFQSASSYSASISTTIVNLSSSIFQTDVTQSNNILINSQSAWGAFTSASSYSASLQTSISASNHRIDELVLGAGAQVGADNIFTGQNTFTQYITGSISGAVDGIDVRQLSASINIIFATTASLNSLSSSIFQTDATQSNQISDLSGSINSLSASVNNLSASIATTDSASAAEIAALSASVASTTGDFSSSVAGRLSTIEVRYATTGSNTFNGNQNILGDITASGNLFVSGTIYATELHTIIQSSSVIFSSGSNQIGDAQSDVLTITGSLNQTGSTSFSELSGSLFDFSSSLNTRLNSGSSNVTTLSSSIYQTDATQSNNISINSASAWGAFQSASAYSASAASALNDLSSSLAGNSTLSASVYQVNATQSANITTVSASAWGAFQSASSYSSSFASRLANEEFKSTTFATTGSNTFIGNQIISGSLNVTGDVVAYSTSDERLKDNIQLISNPIQKVNELRGVEFDWKDGMPKAGKHEYGVIAQDVLKVMPELVNQRQDGYYAVDYDKIVGLLIEVVKQQEKRIKELENKIG